MGLTHEQKLERISVLAKYLKPGDTITHVGCGGIYEEHIFTGRNEYWLRGVPTEDTVRLSGDAGELSDISPANVTHINRVPLEAVPYLIENNRERGEAHAH